MGRDRSGTPDLLRIIRRRWLTIVGAILLTAGAAFGLSQIQEKRYSATAALVFGDPNSISNLLNQKSSSNADPERQAATTVELVAARDVVNRTARKLKRSPNDVASAVEVQGKGVSNVVSVTASDPDPGGAAQLANTYVTQYIELRREADQADLDAAQSALNDKLDAIPSSQRDTGIGKLLQERLDELEVQGPIDTGAVRVAERAFAPESPSSPNVQLNVALGGLIGLLLGLGIATLRERVDNRLLEPEEQSEAFGLPILAALPRGRALEGATETFRGLQARIEHFDYGREIRVVMVTSSSQNEGTSSVAWHLACAAALAADHRVLLIEADMRHPEMAATRGLSARPGLAQVVAGERSLPESVQKPDVGNGAAGAVDNLPDVLTAGVSPRDSSDGGPYEMLDTRAMVDVLRAVDDQYDYVVIDTPPLGQVADAIPLVSHVDGVLVVSARGKATRTAAESLRDLLRALDAPLLGVVLVGAKPGTVITSLDPRPARRRSAQQSGGRTPSRSGS
jgi:tyrosine-protein kinase